VTNTVAIVQARMGSTRLPGKILKPLAGKPALWHLLDRLRRCRHVATIVIATTVHPRDDVVESLCRDMNVACFRGSEEDVLDRYYRAAVQFGADPVLRITADCPVIDPVVVDDVVSGYFSDRYDVYGLGGEFPDGLDCVLYSRHALETAWREASLPEEREHVQPYMDKHPEIFRRGLLKRFHGLAHHRWTLDDESDYQLLSGIFDRLYVPGRIFLTDDILRLAEREPQLFALNVGSGRNRRIVS
jgi:spore coat polysaccharide biosynthesis protein SpsF